MRRDASIALIPRPRRLDDALLDYPHFGRTGRATVFCTVPPEEAARRLAASAKVLERERAKAAAEAPPEPVTAGSRARTPRSAADPG